MSGTRSHGPVRRRRHDRVYHRHRRERLARAVASREQGPAQIRRTSAETGRPESAVTTPYGGQREFERPSEPPRLLPADMGRSAQRVEKNAPSRGSGDDESTVGGEQGGNGVAVVRMPTPEAGRGDHVMPLADRHGRGSGSQASA